MKKILKELKLDLVMKKMNIRAKLEMLGINKGKKEKK